MRGLVAFGLLAVALGSAQGCGGDEFESSASADSGDPDRGSGAGSGRAGVSGRGGSTGGSGGSSGAVSADASTDGNTSCVAGGAPCAASTECCGGQCNGGVCGPPVSCTPAGMGPCYDCLARGDEQGCCWLQRICLTDPICLAAFDCFESCRADGGQSFNCGQNCMQQHQSPAGTTFF